MTVILDLDYTLFDAAAFKEGIAGAFGLPRDIFDSTLQKYFKDKGLPFNAYTHLELLVKNGFISSAKEQAAVKDLGKLLAKADDYLLPQAESVLKSLADAGWELVLITHGDKHWQQTKLDHLTISRYFQKMLVTEGDKADELEPYKQKEKLVLVNDDPEELYHMSRQLPAARTFLVTGPYSRGKADNELYNISDIPELVCK